MSLSSKLAIIQEIQKRKQKESLPVFSFDTFAFDKQKEFFRGEGSRFRTAVCSRRAGKSTGIAGDMIDTCLNEKSVTCLYITGTHKSVKDIIWLELKTIVENFSIECQMDNTNLSVYFPNGSRILTGGAKDSSEIEKFRGLKLKKVYIDECQSIRTHIKVLIDDVLIPALRDLRGSMYLTGTPGPTKIGPFYEYSHNSKWLNTKWTAFENPHMHDPKIGKDLNFTLAEERKIRGINEADPSYRRETFGEWVEDTDALVIKYDEVINHFEHMPSVGKFEHILGIDIGFEDSDAIAVLAYSYDTNEVYLVQEIEKNKQDITALAQEVKRLITVYNPVKMVMDAGALGKKIQEELRLRHGLNIEAADKTRKLEHIEFLNADLRRGVLRIKKNSLFAQDAKLVSWDRSNPEKPEISKSYHSDILDAVLYGYMLCKHYIKIPKEVKKDVHSTEYMDNLEREEAERMQRKMDDPELFEYEESLEEDTLILDDFYSDDEF